MKYLRKNKGITLVALVVTIIILLILAGVAIGTIKNSNLFENAKKANKKYQIAKQDEENKLNEYSDSINLSTTRDSSSKINTLWSGQVADVNAEITLSESYKNYDELMFYLGFNNSKTDLYSTMTLLTQYIEEDNNNFSRGAWGDVFENNYISFKFKNEKNIIITDHYNTPCIYRIVGIKF